jgi:hypothetical protein
MRNTDGMVCYPSAIEQEMFGFCNGELPVRVPGPKFSRHTVAK